MKLKLLFICYLLFTIPAHSQLFQKNIESPQGHLINANLAEVNDGTNDIVIASNRLSTASPEPLLKRLQEDGTMVWSKTYEDPGLTNARIFDITNYFDLIFVTGSVEVNGDKYVLVAKIEASTGNLLASNYYSIISPSFNATGFKVIISESDATGDTNPNPGLVITGFVSNCLIIDPSCSFNIGFALRTDLNLNPIWASEIGSPVSGPLNYDFANGIVETSDGFVITGSTTGQGNSNIQAGVLIHKINFLGVEEWDSSYIFGNSRDVSVDAYYDSTTDEVFVLNNYSSMHHFGVTVVDNALGTIDPNKSWFVNEVNVQLDFYGFSLLESLSTPDNLIVYGYRREYFNGNNTDQSNVIVYEFEKATGNQVGISYQYLSPYQEPQSDVYNFWNGQLPLIYYPDMAIDNTTTTPLHFTVGYRQGEPANGGLSNIEIINVDALKRNACDDIIIDFNRFPLGTVDLIGASSLGSISINETLMSFNPTNLVLVEDSCTSLSLQSQEETAIKLYPNPASAYIYIDQADNVTVRLLDITGKLVLETNNYQNNEEIFIGNLENGIYFINVETSEKASKNFKLIKK